MYYILINKNFVHQIGDQPRLYYNARSTTHQGKISSFGYVTELVVLIYVELRGISVCEGRK
jgi:hypothetical protein